MGMLFVDVPVQIEQKSCSKILFRTSAIPEDEINGKWIALSSAGDSGARTGGIAGFSEPDRIRLESQDSAFYLEPNSKGIDIRVDNAQGGVALVRGGTRFDRFFLKRAP